jgi:hypothetical protein
MGQENGDELAEKMLAALGPAQTLLMSMRLVVLVGQLAEQDVEVLEAAKDAVAAIKRVGALTGVLRPC